MFYQTGLHTGPVLESGRKGGRGSQLGVGTSPIPPPISARVLEVQVGSWELSSVASGPVQRLCVWSANR